MESTHTSKTENSCTVQELCGESRPQLDDNDVPSEVVYTPESDLRQGLSIFREITSDIVRGRELAWRLFQRNIRALYRQTMLGLFWAFLPPLANTAIWVFLNNRIIKFDEGMAVNYTIYVLTGMVFWQSFVEAFQMPLNVVKQNRSMITKLNFPRESLLMVGLSEVLFNFLVRLVVLIPLLFIYQVSLTWASLLAPIAILALIFLATAIGLVLMPIGTIYQDVGKLITVITPLWMILSPIVYPVPTGTTGTLIGWLNPAAALLVTARDLLVQGSTSMLIPAIVFGLLSIPLLMLGLIVYRISLPVLTERMAN